MNIENLLKEIDVEKEKLTSEVELYDTELLSDYYRKDLMFLFPLLFVAAGLALCAGKNGIGLIYTLTTFACMIVPTLPPIFSLFQKKNLSFSYYFKSAFKKQELIKDLVNEKKKVASDKLISNDFLKKIALNMDKAEFKSFLKECDGDVTLNKVEQIVNLKSKEQKKLENIDELTDAIFKENKDLSLEFNKKINIQNVSNKK